MLIGTAVDGQLPDYCKQVLVDDFESERPLR